MYEKHRRRKRRRRKLFRRLILPACILLGVLAAGLGGIGIYKLMAKPPLPQPEETLEAYIGHIQTGDYGAIYDLLTPESQDMLTREELVARYENIYDGIEAVNVTVSIDTVFTEEEKKAHAKGENAAMNYTISLDTIAGPLSFPSSTLLILDEETRTWKMTWDVSEVFPGLATDYKVAVKKESAERGGIYDAYLEPLAAKGEAWTAGVVPGKLEEPREQAIEDVARVMGVSAQKVEKALSAAWVKDDLFVPIRTFSKTNTELKEQMLTVPGILLNTVEERVYLAGAAGSHLIGYVQNITAEELEAKKGQQYDAQSVIGKAGLERALEDTLRSRDGHTIEIVDSEGDTRKKVLVQKPQDGSDVRLTIESSLQQAVYEQLQGDKGLAVVMEPQTGNVLAMVSTPAYDSNDFAFGFTGEAWTAINEDADQPLYNRVRGAWVPGSVFKPVTAAIALENGLDPEKDMREPGLAWQPDAGWGSYTVTTLEDYAVHDLKNAMVHSDNIYFAKAALETGSQAYTQGLEKFGFKEKIPFLVSLDSSGYGEEEQPIAEGPALADSGYGQGEILVNPVHLAAIYASFLNGGNMPVPNVLYEQQPAVWKEQVISERTADTVLECLYAAVEDPEGTAHELYNTDYRLAGKTGTAEKKLSKDDTQGTELGWFVGMTPEEENPVVIVMMIEDVKGRGGSHYVLPKVKAVLDAYYQYK